MRNSDLRFILAVLVCICTNSFSQNVLPEWAKGIVWYQVFPERFSNGDSSNDPEPEKVFINNDSIPEGWKIQEWTSNWFARDEWEIKKGNNFQDNIYERRYGGDLQGIIDRLDYLEELGVGAIYLNPVFEAASLHKYDGSTFHHIDVNFGPDPAGDRKLIEQEIPDEPKTWIWTSADKLFLKLISDIHSRGMKIIIDGVFNHTGTRFWAFQDILVHGQNSKFKDWYIINSFDDTSTYKNEFNYKGWWGIKSLPELNRSHDDLHPGPKQYILQATRRWMDPNGDGDTSDGIDGWRLDVAREVPLGFWRDWSALVKSVNNDAIIIGELWELSPEFVSTDGPFDGLMNYNFAFAVNDFFIAKKNPISTYEFIDRLEEINNTYPTGNLLLLQNLIDSHDTDRLSSMIKNPDRKFDRDAKEGNPNYNPGKPGFDDYELQKLIFAFQLTYLGSPMIYYGDEVGMWGADDPHCRKPMVWNDLEYDDETINETSGFGVGYGRYTVEQNEDLLSFYKKIIKIRNNNDALQKGNIEFLKWDDESRFFVFARKLNHEHYVIGFNLSSKKVKYEFPPTEKLYFRDMITEEEYSKIGGEEEDFSISIPAKSFFIYSLY